MADPLRGIGGAYAEAGMSYVDIVRDGSAGVASGVIALKWENGPIPAEPDEAFFMWPEAFASPDSGSSPAMNFVNVPSNQEPRFSSFGFGKPFALDTLKSSPLIWLRRFCNCNLRS